MHPKNLGSNSLAELIEIERHGSRVGTSSLYQRGRQGNHDQFYTRQVCRGLR